MNPAFDRLLRPLLDERAKQVQPTFDHASAVPQTTASSPNFGGFLAAPSYPAIPYPNPGGRNSSIITLTADFNKDGSPDIATLDSNGNVNVILNDGKGHFGSVITSPGGTPNRTMGAVAADVDGDGYPDVVALQWRSQGAVFSQALLLFHNNHDGSFAAPTPLAVLSSTPGNVGSFLVADVNGDGIPDIVSLSSMYDPVNNWSTVTVQTFLGLGQGVFNTAQPAQSTLTYLGYSLELPNNGALLQALNGKTNLVFEGLAYDDANSGFLIGASVLALASNGDGTFATTPSSEVDFAASYGFVEDNTGGLSLADLNGDGFPDITVAFDDDYIYSALGRSDGTFGPPQVAESGFAANPSGFAVVDVNGDGYPDFVDNDNNPTSNKSYTAVWLGNGDGTFASPQYIYPTTVSSTLALYNSPGSNLAVADFDGDGRLDFAVVDGGGLGYNRASIFLGHGDGSFQGAPAVAVTNDPNTFPQMLNGEIALDLNGDGKMDLLLADEGGSGSILAALSDGKGNFTFKQASTVNPGGMSYQYAATATGDFNHDGLQDTVFSMSSPNNPNGNFLAVGLSNGDGTLKTPIPINMGTNQFLFDFSGISIADVNGDGNLDIVAMYSSYFGVPSGFAVALGNGDGTFQTATYVPMGAAPYASALVDLNGDGKPDLVISDLGATYPKAVSPTVSVIFGDGTGNFNPAKAVVLETGYTVNQILVGDLNGDKKPDLVLLSEGLRTSSGLLQQGQGAYVYLNNGDGTFSQGDVYENGNQSAAGVLADFNNDGVLDLFLDEWAATEATPTYYGAQLMLGNGDGTFSAPHEVQVPPATAVLLPGDFLQDGSLDLVASSYYGSLMMLLNQGGTTISLASSSPSLPVGQNEVISTTIQPTLGYQPLPTGELTFTENGATVGSTDVVDGEGVFSFSGLPTGAHTLTAVYSGDANFNPNANAGTVTFTVTPAQTVAPSFSMQANANSLSIASGQAGTVQLTLTANSAYSGTISFQISGPLNGLSAQVQPTMVTLAPGQTTTATVVVSTVTLASGNHASSPWMRTAGGMSLACFFGLVLPIRRKKIPQALMTIVLVLGSIGFMAGLTGCGGNSSTSNNSSGSKTAPAGQSTLVITATPSISGVAVQAATITVNVH